MVERYTYNFKDVILRDRSKVISTSPHFLYIVTGPVVSLLLERYTCRRITIVGTLVSVVAFVVSVFSPNVEMLIVTYGIIAGMLTSRFDETTFMTSCLLCFVSVQNAGFVVDG